MSRQYDRYTSTRLCQSRLLSAIESGRRRERGATEGESEVYRQLSSHQLRSITCKTRSERIFLQLFSVAAIQTSIRILFRLLHEPLFLVFGLNTSQLHTHIHVHTYLYYANKQIKADVVLKPAFFARHKPV